MELESPIPDHKLCAFLLTILSSPSNSISQLQFGSHCEIFSNGLEFGFKLDSGVVLTPVSAPNDVVLGEGEGNRKRRKSKIGMVQGTMSVINQLRFLVGQKCLRIAARIVRVLSEGEGCGGGEIRVLVLVDVYLPIGLWSGWQFPRSSTTAAALFRHLRCDWQERASILSSEDKYWKSFDVDNRITGNFGYCHVLGCKSHCDVTDSSKKKLFELHEIFKGVPSLANEVKPISSAIAPSDFASAPGIWDLTDDVLVNILAMLHPIDLVRVSSTCHHLRSLAACIMPCIKLKLFPHQQAAVEWMLQRERNAAMLPHPLYLEFKTEDGFSFYANAVSGELVTGTAPKIKDFYGGLFCDEPGLGKTITALSLILKTQGTLAEPPDGAQMIWCTHYDRKCGYYEWSGGRFVDASPEKRCVSQNDRRRQFSMDELTPKGKLKCFNPVSGELPSSSSSCSEVAGPKSSTPVRTVLPYTRSLSRVKKNLIHRYEATSGLPKDTKIGRSSNKRKKASPYGLPFPNRKRRKDSEDQGYELTETRVQCEACGKWRRVFDSSITDTTAAWFCGMNSDPLHRSCKAPEETWDYRQPITYLPGFCDRGSSGGLPQNISFFVSVLKEHYPLLNSHTKKALTWLAKLSPQQLSKMETVGLIRPGLVSGGNSHGFHKIFRAFGLVKKVEHDITRWFYPQPINDLVFDLAALRIALCEPLDSFRMYLSRATLIVVPANLVEHWKTQIQKHVRGEQLRVYTWTGYKKPLAHNLAWDYDVVITTFSRLSAEWNPRKKSVLTQIHWLRLMLDEGHTLGSSINLTNKLQMAVSLTASNRWILTGTPTPNTPNSQLSHLQPMLKFLHEEAYGLNHKAWEMGILKPFEAKMEEGRLRLLQLLNRCMISARKADLQCIPPCIKKTTYLNFTEEHAKTYNELVVTVRRNILMADWNDPSHVESLLNPRQRKFRSSTIRNVRLSCCVAGHIKVMDAGQDIQDTMDILAGNGLDPLSVEYAFIKYNLMFGGNCQRCQEWCRLPIVTPCQHLLCLDCVALDSERCTFPGCGNSYEMQTPETLARPENPNPKWPVPKDLIELQPSYKQDNWDSDWQSTSSSKVAYLIERLKEIQAAHEQSDFSSHASNEVGSNCFPVSSFNGHRWKSLSHQGRSFNPNTGSLEAPVEKVLIFSQFLEHVHVIEQQLTVAGIKFAGMYSPMHSENKVKSLYVFQHDANCMALVMDGSAALGLDLSFVTHVFLMEPIWDRSMEEQVISRAHRMGATRPIHVETLAMRGTIEEQMLEFLQNADDCRRLLKEENGKYEQEGTQAHRSLHDFADRNYLACLSTVRTKA